MWQSIRTRLTLWFVGLVLLLLVVFAASITFAEVRNEAQELTETLRGASQWAARFDADPKVAGGEGSWVLFAPRETVLVARILSPNGKLLRVFGDPTAAAVLARAEPGSRERGALTLPDGRHLQVVREVDRRGHIIEAAGAIQDHRELVRLLSSVALAMPPTLAITLLLALFLADRALRPMGAITRLARELSAGDLSRRISLRGPRDEIRELADTFDQMIERLDQGFSAQRRFASDASHELRTPLTIMRGHVEVALADPETPDAELREALQVVAAELRRLSRLVDDLLMLQRADAGDYRLSLEEVDLEKLAEEAVAGLQRLAQDRRLRVAYSAPVPAQVDPAWFRQLLINLVENAIRHTPAGGNITVTVERDGPRALLAVEDTGTGIAAEHLPRLFDRFYRADRERSRAYGGVGLGLAIVQWIVHAHGGTVGVTSEPGCGSRFVVCIPRSQPRTAS